MGRKQSQSTQGKSKKEKGKRPEILNFPKWWLSHEFLNPKLMEMVKIGKVSIILEKQDRI